MKQLPKVIKNVSSDLNTFINEEIPIFYQSITTNFKVDKNESDNLLREVTDTFLEKLSRTFNASEMVLNLRSDSERILELVKQANASEVLADDIKTGFDIDTLLNEAVNALKGEIDQVDFDLSKFSEDSGSIIDGIKEAVQEFNSSTYITQMLPQIEDDITNVLINYYQYFYYTLLVVSVFVLFLFLLYATGLVGICARRTNLSKRQCCHRTTMARIMLAGVGFFFIFSWLLLVFSITMLVPGIFARQLVCKPAIEIENNQLFKVNSTSYA